MHPILKIFLLFLQVTVNQEEGGILVVEWTVMVIEATGEEVTRVTEAEVVDGKTGKDLLWTYCDIFNKRLIIHRDVSYSAENLRLVHSHLSK